MIHTLIDPFRGKFQKDKLNFSSYLLNMNVALIGIVEHKIGIFGIVSLIFPKIE